MEQCGESCFINKIHKNKNNKLQKKNKAKNNYLNEILNSHSDKLFYV